MQQTWRDVDQLLERSYPEDPALEAALRASAEAGLPQIQVSAHHGRMLHLLATLMGARRILEVGTLGGYSAIWLARALPSDGRLVTLELDPKHAEVARDNLARADLAAVTEVRVGDAAGTLRTLREENADPFDLVFLDADKQGYPKYLELSLELCRPGALLVADNVVRNGRILDEDSADPSVQGVREFLRRCAEHPRLEPVVLQTVGNKGYDGLAFVRVL